MTLNLFLRAITVHMFQNMVTTMNRSFNGEKMDYDNTFFHIMRIHCKDGFNISIQINHGNYCETEVGYRKFGFEWISVEFGFSNVNDKRIAFFAEEPDSSQSVGRIETAELQKILDKHHGGIDWEKTLSIEECIKFYPIDLNKTLKSAR